MDSTTNGEATEYQKMVNGDLYNTCAADLQKRNSHAKLICLKYNSEVGYSEDLEQREQNLRQLFGKLGPGCMIEPPLRVDYGENIEIGSNFYANFDTVILDCGKVKIGDNVRLGPGCHLYTAEHPLDVETRCVKQLQFAKPITIGNNVWLGGRVIVLPGVTIGDGCVIGAGSVVTKDIPEYSLAVGNPCRVIRSIASQTEIGNRAVDTRTTTLSNRAKETQEQVCTNNEPGNRQIIEDLC